MSAYSFLLHSESFRRLQDYHAMLAAQGLSRAGGRLRVELQGLDVGELDDHAFLEHLINTKSPRILAEESVYGDGRDWNPTELSLLGDLGIALSVRIFDDGHHHAPQVHEEPLTGTLLFTPGALLCNHLGGVAGDWSSVTHGGRIDSAGYRALYERRLLPPLLYVEAQARAAGQQALVTLPGLGCGHFAGPFQGTLGAHLKDTLLALLGQHAGRLPHIRAIHFDPFNECANERHDFGGLSVRVRPLAQGNQHKPQLCQPQAYAEDGEDFTDLQLYSVVAWDPVSWPGNDFWGGARTTDDGVKAAATDAMRVLTGVEGHYDPHRGCYEPPSPYRTWEQVALSLRLRLRLDRNLWILG
jgi:hypothetical protein